MPDPSYHYKPKSFTKTDWQNLKRLFLSLLGIILILTFLYFFAVIFLSNVNLFWGIFRPGWSESSGKQDRIPPPPPYLQSVPKATNQDSLRISGFSEPGAKVTLFRGGAKIGEVVVDSEGGFSFEEVKLFEGENKIYAQAKDQAENESKPSTEQVTVYDKKPPKLVVESPQDKTVIEDEEERTVEIKGRVEDNLKVQITVNEQWTRADDEGNFSHRFRLEEGENKIKVVAKDEAGNETEKELTVSYEPPEEEED